MTAHKMSNSLQTNKEDRLPARAQALLRILLPAAAGLFVLLFLGIAVLRMGYPYELEWMEGGMADHVIRILQGEAVYAPPTPEFAAYTYTPLYLYLSAAITRWMMPGMPLQAMRLLSTAASVGCLALIFLFVKRETRSFTGAALSAGLFAAAYGATGCWYDIARSDTLFLFFVLAALPALQRTDRALPQTAAAVFMTLAFLTKQTALFVAIPFGIYALLAGRGWKRLLFPVLFAGLTGAAVLMLNRTTNGWFSFYAFELPSRHPTNLFRALSFWIYDIGRTVPIVIALAIGLFALLWKHRETKRLLFYAMLTAAFFGSAWMIRMKGGSFLNTLIPAYAGAALLLGVSFGFLMPCLDETSPDAPRQHDIRILRTALLAACFVQLAILFYNPQNQLPTQRDRMAGDHYVELLAQFDGDVFAPTCGYLPRLAQKNPTIQTVALQDIDRAANDDVRNSLRGQITERIRNQSYDALILDEAILEESDWIVSAASNTYRCAGPVFNTDEVFRPVTGRPARPHSLYIRNGLPLPQRTPQKTEPSRVLPSDAF